MYISSCAAESDHYLNLKKSLLFYQTSSTYNQKKRMYFKTSSAPQTKPSCSTKRVLKRALCSTKRALCSVKTALFSSIRALEKVCLLLPTHLHSYRTSP